MNWQCSQCNKLNVESANFCSGCGLKKLQAIKTKGNSNTLIIVSAVLASLIFACVLFGGLGAIMDKTKDEEVKSSTPTPTTTATPTPTPKPTFAELKKETEELLELEKEEYKTEDLKPFDDLRKSLEEIPKNDKDYRNAKLLIDKLIKKSSTIGAEILVLGDKPSDSELKMAFNNYLRNRLNDYSSSEYVNFTSATKLYVEKEPFWYSVLRLRAKNAFGAYIITDVKVYLRKKEVVLMEGLN